jgi:hypothetical protein
MSHPAFDPRAIVDSDLSVSDKVRRLNAAGLGRSEIAKLVDRSYQQVRQVLVEDERRALRSKNAAPSGPARAEVREQGATFAGIVRLEVEPGGVLRMPPEMRQVLGARDGGVLIVELGEDRATILSARAAMAKIDALVASLNIDPGRTLSEELIAERRAENLRDSQDV